MTDRRSAPARLAVVVFQLGGPDTLSAVEPFLYNLFRDPDIIDFPFARLARQPLARLVARHRAGKVWEHYAEIGGGSPINELTRRQAAALEGALSESLPARVFVAMRYWHPLTEEAVAEITGGHFDEIVLLPLYPQYSRVTTGSSLNEWNRRYRHTTPVRVVKRFYDHPLYLQALRERINEALSRFPVGADVHLLFSAHGVPEKIIHNGDPYQRQTEETMRLVMQRGGWPNEAQLCYQSKVGPGRWLGPMLHETLPALRARGVRHLLVVPISFVTDHIETLHEIDLDARRQAAQLGLEQFEMMPALNDSPTFIRALADLVLTAVGEKQESASVLS